jgi:hypothetical protein
MAIAKDIDIAVRQLIWQESAVQRLGWDSTRTPEMFYYARARALRAEAFGSFFRSLGRFPTAATKSLRHLRRQAAHSGALGKLPRGLTT